VEVANAVPGNFDLESQGGLCVRGFLTDQKRIYPQAFTSFAENGAKVVKSIFER
jgi:hypothetical protein